VRQALWLILTSVVMLAPPAVQPGDTPSDGRDALRRLAELDRAAQGQWARAMLDRLDRANRKVLDPTEAARRDAEYIEPLRRALQGRAISPSELAELLETTDQREKAVIDKLARQFRVQVYKTFRQQRGVFTRRRMAWNRVESSWEEAGRPLEQQDRLIDWLASALHNSMPETAGPLPDEPAFEAVERVEAPVAVAQVAVDEPPIPTEPIAVPTEPPISLPTPQPPVVAPPIAEPPAEPPAMPPSPPAATPRPSIVGESPAESVEPALPVPWVDEKPPPPIPDEPPPPVEPTPTIEVNLDELTARIAGVNLELRALEADLDQPWQWNAKRLGPLVDRLKGLMTRRNDLRLVLEIISPQERSSVDQLESPQAAISRLASKVFETRTRVTGPDFSGTEAQRRAELRHLDELSRELASLASGR